MAYTADFKRRVQTLFPGDATVREWLTTEDRSIDGLLDDLAREELDAATVVGQFESGKSEDVLTHAKRIVEARALMEEWESLSHKFEDFGFKNRLPPKFRVAVQKLFPDDEDFKERLRHGKTWSVKQRLSHFVNTLPADAGEEDQTRKATAVKLLAELEEITQRSAAQRQAT